jgi:hypothetical protein
MYLARTSLGKSSRWATGGMSSAKRWLCDAMCLKLPWTPWIHCRHGRFYTRIWFAWLRGGCWTVDYVRFRAVCPSWRSSTECPRGHGIRWMMLPEPIFWNLRSCQAPHLQGPLYPSTAAGPRHRHSSPPSLHHPPSIRDQLSLIAIILQFDLSIWSGRLTVTTRACRNKGHLFGQCARKSTWRVKAKCRAGVSISCFTFSLL